MFSRFNRRPDIWLPSYLFSSLGRAVARRRRKRQHTHIILIICDHFEPRHGVLNDLQPFERLQTWRREYARFQERCSIQLGIAPVHTWFYPPHHGIEHLAMLSEMVFDGLGEVELHYHHENDTSETLRRNLTASILDFQRWGFLLQSGERPKTSFGFIHGDWALDNSCDGEFCGVNDELEILQELGCWGDFTMPSGNQCQTRRINSIYYAVDDPHAPKSHDSGTDARVGIGDPRGLFLMQGPLAINWGAPDHPRIENASLTTRNWGRPDRIRKWIDCNVHVAGKDDWLFVKLHTHGAIERDFEGLFGEKAFEMYRTLGREYNDGRRYSVHCVTARQAYNIAKAAEQGKSGSPIEWADFIHPPQPHHYYTLNVAHQLVSCTPSSLVISKVEGDASTSLRTRVGSASHMTGQFSAVDIDVQGTSTQLRAVAPGAALALVLRPNMEVVEVEGARLRQSERQESKAIQIDAFADVIRVVLGPRE